MLLECIGGGDHLPQSETHALLLLSYIKKNSRITPEMNTVLHNTIEITEINESRSIDVETRSSFTIAEWSLPASPVLGRQTGL